MTVSFKIVWYDGYGRDSINEELIADNIRTIGEGRLMLDGLRFGASEADRYKLVESEYQLFRRNSSLPYAVSHGIEQLRHVRKGNGG